MKAFFRTTWAVWVLICSAVILPARALAQQPTGVQEFTGALLVKDLKLVESYGSVAASAFASYFPKAVLQSASTAAGSPVFGSAVSGSRNFGLNLKGNTFGTSVNWSYVVGPNGNLWLQYTVSAGFIAGGSTTSQIDTDTPGTIINGTATASTPGLNVVGVGNGSYGGRSGQWVTIELEVTYGFMDAHNVYNVIGATDRVTFFSPTPVSKPTPPVVPR